MRSQGGSEVMVVRELVRSVRAYRYIIRTTLPPTVFQQPPRSRSSNAPVGFPYSVSRTPYN